MELAQYLQPSYPATPSSTPIERYAHSGFPLKPLLQAPNPDPVSKVGTGTRHSRVVLVGLSFGEAATVTSMSRPEPGNIVDISGPPSNATPAPHRLKGSSLFVARIDSFR